MELRTKEGDLVCDLRQQEKVIEIEEDKLYHLAIQVGESARQGWKAWFGEVELSWGSKGSGFELRTRLWTGLVPLRIQTPSGEHSFEVLVQPRTQKLSPSAWATLLRELDSWIPGGTVGQMGGMHGDVSTEGNHAPGVAAVLGELVPAFLDALQSVLRAPRERLVEQETEAPLHTVRKAGRGTLRWLDRHPELWQRVQGKVEETELHRQALVPQQAWRGHLDHPANRYTLWLVNCVIKKLREVAERVRQGAKKKSLDPDLKHWCEARATPLEEGAQALERLIKQSVLKKLSPEPASMESQLVISNDPMYGHLHRFGQIFLSPRFRLPDKSVDLGAPVRPSYELYELWAFLKVQRLLTQRWSGLKWKSRGVHKLCFFDKNPNGATYTAYRSGWGKLQLFFNLTFPGFLVRKQSRRWSISKERRPDMVLTWAPERGKPRWLCLDAKYRTDHQQVADALTSAHVYRDSLRWNEFGDDGRCAGAMLLVPAMLKEAEPWFHKDFRNEHGVGAFQLTPGQPEPQELLEWIGETLGLPGPERPYSD